MKKNFKTPLATAVGVAVISTLTANVANAEANPFGMNELSQGYMQLADAGDMSMFKPEEERHIPKDHAAGTKVIGITKAPETTKAAESKAGEMKCGGMMDGDKMKAGMESACGAMMKGKEGACGMMPMGEKAQEGACGAGMKTDAEKPANTQAAEVKPADSKAAEIKPADSKAAEASCGGMMDGDKMKKGMESACGTMMKGKEGACGMMPMGEKAQEGACGAGMKTDAEKPANAQATEVKPADTKAAEATSSGMMDGDKMKKGMESACGAMMKGKEGACGMMPMGEKAQEGAGMTMPENKGTTNANKTSGVKVIPYTPTTK